MTIELVVEVLVRGEPGTAHWLRYGDGYAVGNLTGCERDPIGMVRATGWPLALSCAACVEAYVADRLSREP